MSLTSRLFLAPLAALCFASACDAGPDEFDALEDAETDADTGDALRTLSAFTIANLAYNPQSGTRTNTNNMGGWPFAAFDLRGQMHKHMRLIDVETAPFAGGRPGWEIGDVPPYLSVDFTDTLQLDVSPEHMLVGTAGAYSLQHSDFHDSLWTVEVDPSFIPELDAAQIAHTNGILTMRLEVSWHYPDDVAIDLQDQGEDLDEQAIVAQGGVPLYTFWYGQAGESVSTCASQYVNDHHGTGAVFFRDLSVDDHSGEVVHESDRLYIACTKGAVGKAAAKWGYWPSEMDPFTQPGDGRTSFETAVRVVRADYCGDGVSWTLPGTKLEVFDSLVHTSTTDTAHDTQPERSVIEAVWDAGGALCLDYPRIAGNYPSCAPTSCNDTQSAFHWLQYMGAAFLTRTDRLPEPNPNYP